MRPYFLLAMLLISLLAVAQEKAPVAMSDKSYPPQLSGTVVDSSGAVIAGATVQVRSANGTVQTTAQSDKNGSFVVSGISAGHYQLVVSSPGFETKEMPVTIGTTEAPALLRISLCVSTVRSTVTVKGRADSLIGVADSASQGTVGAKEIQARPILRSGEILETVPGLIITQHAGGGKANQYFYVASISTTAQISPFSSMVCRLTCLRTRMVRGTRT